VQGSVILTMQILPDYINNMTARSPIYLANNLLAMLTIPNSSFALALGIDQTYQLDYNLSCFLLFENIL
jgi:hypothetical protein